MSSSIERLSQHETIALLLQRSGRPTKAVPIRSTFVQRGTNLKPKPGPLASLVAGRRGRPLDLLLLVHAVASAGDFSVTEWSTTWARCIGLFDDSSGPTAVSRCWKCLQDERLIKRGRGEKGKARITVLREDGSGRRYSHPWGKGKQKKELYFQLPYEYWDEEHRYHLSLSLPGKAMLLIALSMTKEQFSLPQERVPQWYGISADTAGRGLAELRDRGILIVSGRDRIPTLKSKTGYADRYLYTLQPPFDLSRRGMGRRSRRKKA